VLIEGTFERGAKRFGMTQPALSQQDRALKAELGGTLLDRQPTGGRVWKAPLLKLVPVRASPNVLLPKFKGTLTIVSKKPPIVGRPLVNMPPLPPGIRGDGSAVAAVGECGELLGVDADGLP